MKFFEILLPISFILTDICSFFTERKFDYFVLFIDLPIKNIIKTRKLKCS